MITDFVLALDGVTTYHFPSWREDHEAAGTEAYYKRRKELKQQRVLLFGACGAQGTNIESIRDQIIDEMRTRAGGRFDRAGVVCLFGSSNGAAVALALAAALQNELTINYICLADLPLFMGGRKPPVPGVGALSPSAPNMLRTAVSRIGSSTVQADGDRPKVWLQPDINAKVKNNYYQHSGNGIRTSILSGNWFWTSDMKGEEVHGVIANSGWNSDQEVFGLTIAHQRLNNLVREAGDAFHQKLDDYVASDIWAPRWPAELAKI